MPTKDYSRSAYFLTLLGSTLLGFVISRSGSVSWIPYVLLGMISLSLGLLLYMLTNKRAGLRFSWPALIALGVTITMMSTALFTRYLP